MFQVLCLINGKFVPDPFHPTPFPDYLAAVAHIEANEIVGKVKRV